MTDQPSTNLGDVIVTGQRRRPDNTFPDRGSDGSTGGGLRDDSGTQQNEVSDDPNPMDPSPGDPCADPETALPWNADAAGAGSVDKFLQKAGVSGRPGCAKWLTSLNPSRVCESFGAQRRWVSFGK